jgi:RNA polymerase sigma-32 factor
MSTALPILASEAGLSRYLEEIKKFPVLTEEKEYELAKRWKDHADVAAAQELVASYLRLVAKMAMKFRGYGLPMLDVISEGNIGLMQAVKRFDPDKGYKLATYAMWWIKAAIQDYILRSWSMVRIGTSATQKKLFFNLRRVKNKLLQADGGGVSPFEEKLIAQELDVKESEVAEMNSRLSQHDSSLNSHVFEEDDKELIDILPDTADNQEVRLLENQEMNRRRRLLHQAIGQLNEREQDIIAQTALSENPANLEVLSHKYGISRERVRQIKERALEKIRLEVLQHA